ncbi:ribonuclease E/G [Roseicitreum antarcticum]|uniref:Ribonuclease, Rne/Rng family n=1 Tax=Roseicitreum antarcticum TaxID=564137 RepID=A0A1H2VZD5_9RHOB|nr:ribonuclease E/G [Roseicitreum antarcticum]SDW73705.1 ribonuclease, Rne/Rng family [Roseicitreum antarcticum]
MNGITIALGILHDRQIAARIIDGQLEDLLIALPDTVCLPEAIYRARVGRQMKGMGGVFLDLPDGQRAFLKQAKGLRPGDALLVQVTGVSEAGKAVPVATRLLFKSRYAIVTPDAPGLNVSRQIREADEQARLTAIASAAMHDSPHGLILRSAAEGVEDTALRDDITAMCDLAQAVLGDRTGPPELLVEGPTPHVMAWRDWAVPDPDEVDDSPTALADHGVAEALDALLSPDVPLPGGAVMAVEGTRALIAVDVNTGGDASPAAALKANLAAARALPRELRLRGLGGQVVIDFAPASKKDRQVLEQTLRAAFRRDSSETTLAGWTPLGNFEVQRKRDRMPLADLLRHRD